MFHPCMLLKVVLRGNCVEVGSTRELAKATYEDVPTRWLTTDRQPRFTISDRLRRRALHSWTTSSTRSSSSADGSVS